MFLVNPIPSGPPPRQSSSQQRLNETIISNNVYHPNPPYPNRPPQHNSSAIEAEPNKDNSSDIRGSEIVNVVVYLIATIVFMGVIIYFIFYFFKVAVQHRQQQRRMQQEQELMHQMNVHEIALDLNSASQQQPSLRSGALRHLNQEQPNSQAFNGQYSARMIELDQVIIEDHHQQRQSQQELNHEDSGHSRIEGGTTTPRNLISILPIIPARTPNQQNTTRRQQQQGTLHHRRQQQQIANNQGRQSSSRIVPVTALYQSMVRSFPIIPYHQGLKESCLHVVGSTHNDEMSMETTAAIATSSSSPLITNAQQGGHSILDCTASNPFKGTSEPQSNQGRQTNNNYNNNSDQNTHLNKGIEQEAAEEEKDVVCPICLEVYKENENVRELPCGHFFHVPCIDPWLIRVMPVCPLCKTDFHGLAIDMALATSTSSSGNPNSDNNNINPNSNIVCENPVDRSNRHAHDNRFSNSNVHSDDHHESVMRKWKRYLQQIRQRMKINRSRV